MQLVADVATRKKISELVQEALDRHQPRNYRITVDRNAIVAEDDWYRILVTTENDVRDRDFYDALAEAEADLQDRDGHQFVLVPALGD